jgi:hypothetical protein
MKKIIKKMKQYKFVLLMILLACWSCQNQLDNDKATENEELPPLTNLAGTTWKFAGFANSKTEEMQKLKLTDCDACFTLMFDTDSSFTAISLEFRMKVDFRNLEPDYAWNQDLYCERYDKDGQDYCDVNRYYMGILTAKSFSATNKELKIFGKSKEQYLSFVPHNGENPSTSRRGTQWKLEGVVDVETGEIEKLEPTNCEQCYKLSFLGDYVFDAHSIQVYQRINLLNLDTVLDPTRPWSSWGDRPPLYEEIWPDTPYGNGDGKTYEDSYYFRCKIADTKSYELTPDELKLYDKGREHYLLFKLIEGGVSDIIYGRVIVQD